MRDYSRVLPPKALERWDELQILKAKLRAAYLELNERFIQKQRIWEEAESRFKDLQAMEDSKMPVRAASAQVNHNLELARKELAEAEQRMKTARAAREKAAAQQKPLVTLVQRIETYLAELPAQSILKDIDAPTDTLKPRCPSNIAAEFDLIRTARGDAEQSSSLVSAAPLPSTIAKARAREQVAALAERGRPDVFGLVERGEAIRFAQDQMHALLPASGSGPTHVNIPVQDAVATLAWLFREQMMRAIEEEIDRRSDDDHALTDEQRHAQRKTLGARIFELECQESALWWRFGQHLPPREDIDPRAALLFDGPKPSEY